MNPIKPLSLKIRPEVRSRLKQVAYRMGWSEHQLGKNALEAILDRIERDDSTALDRLMHLSRAAADLTSSVSEAPASP
jgi:predicted transcriptional regulator